MKISSMLAELTKIKAREGDIDVTTEGFFGEVLSPKMHIRNRCTKRKAYYCPTIDGSNAVRGPRVLQISHL
jgi:hypothetical protein